MVELLKTLKSFDAYPKTMEDFRVRTASGAAVSIISGIIIVWLFASEFMFFLSTDVQPSLFVDTTRGQRLRINMDITFPDLPCGFLTVDAMDSAGEHQLDVAANVFKKRLDAQGRLITSPIKRQKLGAEEEFAVPAEVAAGDGDGDGDGDDAVAECGSCYGAESKKGQCCNTCEEVQAAYRTKGWAFKNTKGITQCEVENWAEKVEEQRGEGCQVYGFMLVNKVAGNFHIAPGKSFQQHHSHVHDIESLGGGVFNLTHTINRLSFGPDYPNMVNPLDGLSKQAPEGNSMYQYFVKVVPTVYEKAGGRTINTNQFSVTEHLTELNVGGEHSHGLPGVFFMYDLSPIMVRFTESRRSFTHFLTGVCAIIGGVFTVAGIVDSMIYHGVKSLKAKVELGKAS